MPTLADDSLSNLSDSSLDTPLSHDDSSSAGSSCHGDENTPGFLSNKEYRNSEMAEMPELVSVQMEVTQRLMEGEKRRLRMLQKELGMRLAMRNISSREVELLKQNIQRIESQYQHLDEEYRLSCKVALVRRSQGINKIGSKLKSFAMKPLQKLATILRKKSPRSQPAIGIKPCSKARPTIFGTVAEPPCPSPNNKKNRESVSPQMLSLSQMFGCGSGYVGTSDNNNHNNRLSNGNNESLIFQNGNLYSGPLEALIQHLVPTADYYPDRTYTFAFLLSSRLFIRPHDLLAQVFKLCVLQQNLQDSVDNRNRLGLDKFGAHLVNLLSEWTEMFPYDFRDERMMKQLRDVTQKVIAICPDIRKDMNNLSYNLVTRLTNLKSYEENLTKLESEEQHRAQTQIVATTDIMEVCPSPLTLAQQLTHVELERLSMIGPEEFVQAFSKERMNAEMYQDMKSTHNLESYVQWFNRLSYLVASEITSHMKKKNRVKMIEYFIDVAKECINIGNFNSLMAIIAGMNLSPVTRLKKTWSKVNQDKLKILEHQMDPSNNFSSYRSCLKAAMWRSEGAGEEREKIVIPFFSLFVKDLYFLNEGCASRQEDGSVNFQKCWQLAKQVSDLISWQQVECPFEKDNSILNYVLTTPVYKETMLNLASYECETPDTSSERERYKQLKSQMSL